MQVAIATAERPATYADLAAAPEHLVAEIIDGRLVTHPRPAPRHAAASSALGFLIGPPYQLGIGGPGGWIILDEPELHLGHHIVVPDLAGWRRERIIDRADLAHFVVAPDWVCETLSPSTERYDRGPKRRHWFRQLERRRLRGSEPAGRHNICQQEHHRGGPRFWDIERSR